MKAAWQRLTSRQQSYTLAAGIALVSLGAGYGLATLGDGPTGNSADSSAANEAGCKEVAYWYDPMKSDQHFDKPGKSPFMDMQLVAKCAGGEAAGEGGGTIDPTLVQDFARRTAQAEVRGPEPAENFTGNPAHQA